MRIKNGFGVQQTGRQSVAYKNRRHNFGRTSTTTDEYDHAPRLCPGLIILFDSVMTDLTSQQKLSSHRRFRAD
jgi:hypothetical protein